jgi:phosphate starvation-inducible PhoH-like protein
MNKKIPTGAVKIISPSAKTRNQKRYIKAIENYDIVICEGPAGTGKTHLAIGMAINMYQRRMVDKIIIARPVVEAGENMGFLPGDIDSKMDPYVRPAFDELENFLDHRDIELMRKDHHLEIVPIAYMRGRTFKDSFIVCDECQNLTSEQMKMLLTRVGTGSRIVLTGDIEQSDLKHQFRGAFEFTYYLLSKDEECAAVKLTEEDIQRHSIVTKIVKNWKKEFDNFKNHAKLEGDEIVVD